MTQRTYRQHCPLARALDLVGERWTLLVLRDLLGRPRRYGELLAGLPGLGTNLLADRLQRLGELGLVRIVSRGEARAYALTAEGRRLEPALLALAAFGLEELGRPREGDLWRLSWSPLELRAAFRPEEAGDLDAEFELRVGDEVVWVRVRRGECLAGPGPARLADLVLEATPAAWLRFRRGLLDAEALVAEPGVSLRGPLALLHRLAALLAAVPSGDDRVGAAPPGEGSEPGEAPGPRPARSGSAHDRQPTQRQETPPWASASTGTTTARAERAASVPTPSSRVGTSPSGRR
jgi:DNA-binding HxlR family transcriptional regulator